MLRLRTLGALDLTGPDGQRVRAVVAQPKRLALLVYLAQARPRGPHRRDRLLTLFWPESDDARARSNLSQSLYQLRSALGEDAIVGAGAEPEVNRERLRCDACAFEDALEAGELERALDLYEGGFLESFHLPDAPEFERWVDVERTRLREAAAGAALELSERRLSEGRDDEAANFARRALEIAPYHEAALRHLIEALDRSGLRPAAAESFDAFAERLATDLDLEPAPETQELMERIRSRESGPTRPVEGAGHGPGTAAPVLDEPEIGRPSTAGQDELPAPARTRRVRVAVTAAALVGILMVAVGGGRMFSDQTVPDRVVVVPFQDMTGDTALAALGDVAADWTTVGLVRTGMVDVVDPRWLFRQVYAEGTQHALRIPEALSGETRAALVVWGRYYRVADSLLFTASVLDSDGRTVLREIDPVRVPAANPMDGIGRVRERVVGLLAALIDPRLASWATGATSSPEYPAYQAYVRGLGAWFANEVRPAVAARHFREALALDSTFVAVLPFLYEALTASGQKGAADSLLAEIRRKEHLLAPYDRAVVDVMSGWNSGDREAMLLAARRLSSIAPSSPDANYYHGWAAITSNRFSEAIRAFQRLEREPGAFGAFSLANFPAMAYHRLGQFREEQAYLRRLRRRMPDEEPMLCKFLLLPLAADSPGRKLRSAMDECLASQTPEEAGAVRIRVAAELRAHGHHDAARAVAHAAAAHFRELQRAHPDEPRHAASLGRALLEAGEFEEAKRVYEAILGPNRVQVVRRWGEAAALGGDLATAEEALRRLAADPQVQELEGWGALLRGRILAALGRHEEALELLRVAVASGFSAAESFHADIALEPLHGHPDYEALIAARD